MVNESTYPGNMQILYFYDDLDRMTEIKRYVDGSNDEVLMDNVQYNPENLLTQFDYGNDLRATFTYDSRDRLSTTDVKNEATYYLDLDFTYGSNSNITQIINSWRDTGTDWNSDTESYSYDGLDRLTAASCTFWSHSYSYDKVGNRTAKDGVTYTINSVNEVTALSDGTSFIYNDNGSRTQKTKGTDTWNYTYDYANRLMKVEKNDSVLEEYIYDGEGKRIQSIEDSATTYVYSGIDIVFEETATGTASYIYGPTGRLAKITTFNEESNTFYCHTDHLGSTRLVTDENRNIISAVTYHPFGIPSTSEGEEGYLFNQKEKDSSGLYYYGARYYDPEVGRFISRDFLPGRLRIPQTLNQYTYVLNNPLKYRDPTGFEAAGALLGEGGGYPSLDFSGNPVNFSWAPQKIGEETSPGNPACLLGMGLLLVGLFGGPAFVAWLLPAINLQTLALAIIIFIITFIVDMIWDEYTFNRMKETYTEQECLDFFDFLMKYCEERGIDPNNARVTVNSDGSITITFADGSRQTFARIDGCWVPVPTPPEPDGQPEPSGGSGNPSSGSSIPPIGPVARGFSIV
jgi:RHS repeat-associated protein